VTKLYDICKEVLAFRIDLTPVIIALSRSKKSLWARNGIRRLWWQTLIDRWTRRGVARCWCGLWVGTAKQR